MKRTHDKRPKLYQFRNCRLLRDSEIITDDLWVRDGKIIDPRIIFWEEQIKADVQIDCNNVIICPGFIDVQINGGFGVDFSSDTDKLEEGLVTVAKGLLQHGVTSFCPTIVTSTQQSYNEILKMVKRTPGGENGAEILGAHLEGPFLNPDMKGAHKAHLMRQISTKGAQEMEDFYGTLDHVSIVTLAPELAGENMESIKQLVQRNIVVSIGHSAANEEIAEQAAKKGATFITHLFNAMLPFHHRDPGIVGLLTSYDIPKPMFYGLIADGIHTHPTATRIAHRSHPTGLVLITDAIAALGLPPGLHKLGPMKVEIDHEKATLQGTNTLAGSIASMDVCIQRFKKMSGCTIVEALEGATLHPAQLLQIEHRKGILNYNSDADLVFVDDDLNVHATFIAGEPVWLKKGGLVTGDVQLKYNLISKKVRKQN
ncbi:N-acetylglucosamine-6-phosphate deacetylase-like [Porites lutea]|uniref:N-acetylglucosamine-6-phosphate deacetylase-like n=1 Tax=Porites lutea TaxID=51062 RepID=UPI003CC616C5